MSYENDPDSMLSQSSGYSSTDVSGASAGSGSKLPLPPYKPVPSVAESSLTSDKRSVNVHYHYTYHGCQFQYTAGGGLSTDEVLDPVVPSSVVKQESDIRHHGHRQKAVLGVPSPKQQALESLAPQLIKEIDPMALLPHLTSQGLVSTSDAEYIRNDRFPTRERNMHILYNNILKKGSGTFDRFIECLENEQEHRSHRQLARKLQEMHTNFSRHGSQSTLALKSDTCCTSLLEEGMRKQQHRKKNNSDTSDEETGPDKKLIGQKRSRRLGDSTSSLSMGSSESVSSAGEQQMNHKTSSCHKAKASHKVSAKRHEKAEEANSQDYEKLKWLDAHVQYANCTEKITLTSKTNCMGERRIIHSGNLLQDHCMVWAIVFTDFLLVLQVLKPHSQMFTYEWFSENKFIAQPPLLFHLVHAVKRIDGQTYSFSLHHSEKPVQDVVFKACTKMARDYWVDKIEQAIAECRRCKQYPLPRPIRKQESSTVFHGNFCIAITIDARDLVHCCTTGIQNLFCSIKLGKRHIRTKTVCGIDSAYWDLTFEFWDYSTRDALEIRVLQENLYCPNDLMGSVKIKVSQALCHTESQGEFNLLKDRTICGKITLHMGLREEQMKEMYV